MLSIEAVETDHEAYAARRRDGRRRMIALRRTRRVSLGPLLSVEFENAETLAHQVQEIVFAERTSDPGEVAREVGLYSRLLPGPELLVATVLIELVDPATVRAELGRLDGVQRALQLRVGGQVAGAEELPGPDGTGGSGGTGAVHFVGFRLAAPARAAFLDPATDAFLAVEHPGCRAEVALNGETRASLASDLGDRPPG